MREKGELESFDGISGDGCEDARLISSGHRGIARLPATIGCHTRWSSVWLPHAEDDRRFIRASVWFPGEAATQEAPDAGSSFLSWPRVLRLAIEFRNATGFVDHLLDEASRTSHSVVAFVAEQL